MPNTISINSPDGVSVVVNFHLDNAVRAFVSQAKVGDAYDPANNVSAQGLGNGDFTAAFTPLDPLFKFQCVDLFTGFTEGDRVFEVFQIAPSLPVSAPDQVTIEWNTPFDGDETVYYGTASGALSSSMNDGDIATTHQVTLSNLTANTQYFYRCGSKPVGPDTMDDYEVLSDEANFTTPVVIPPVVRPDKVVVQLSKQVVRRGESLTVTATVTGKNTSGQQVPVAGADVAFSFLLLPRGTFVPNPVKTDAQGKSVTTLTVGQLAGPAVVVAKCQMAAGAQALVIRWL